MSASVPNELQCPPVVVIGVPAARRRGPGIVPAASAFRNGNMTSFRLPRSLMVVTPDIKADRKAWVPLIMNVSLDSVVMCL